MGNDYPAHRSADVAADLCPARRHLHDEALLVGAAAAVLDADGDRHRPSDSPPTSRSETLSIPA
jgi:hypothetical protein